MASDYGFSPGLGRVWPRTCLLRERLDEPLGGSRGSTTFTKRKCAGPARWFVKLLNARAGWAGESVVRLGVAKGIDRERRLKRAGVRSAPFRCADGFLVKCRLGPGSLLGAVFK